MRPKDIGTRFENRTLEKFLQPVWPNAGRGQAQGSNDYGDFFNVNIPGHPPHLAEAKDRKTWALPDWIRTIYKKIDKAGHKVGETPWTLWFKQRPMRDIREDLCVMPSWFAAELLQCYMEGRTDDESQ